MAVFGGARGLAQAFLRSAAESGLKVSDAISALQQGGLATYRRTSMLADYRQFLGIPEKADRLKYMRMDYTPDPRNYTVTKGYQHSPLRYQLNVDVYKPLTDERFTMSTNVVSDVPLTRRQIEEAGIDSVRGGIDKSQFDITGYSLFGAFSREGDTWD